MRCKHAVRSARKRCVVVGRWESVWRSRVPARRSDDAVWPSDRWARGFAASEIVNQTFDTPWIHFGIDERVERRGIESSILRRGFAVSRLPVVGNQPLNWTLRSTRPRMIVE